MSNVIGGHALSSDTQHRLQTLRAAQLAYAQALESSFAGNRTPTLEQQNAVNAFQTSCLWAQTAITMGDPLATTET
jgi:hypothetical protein